MTDDDVRDENVGALLQVAPLDDVTKRRLVTTAVREIRPSRTGRWLAAAAAAAVGLVLVVGGAVLLSGPGKDDQQAATPAGTPAAGRPSPTSSAPAAPPDFAPAAGAEGSPAGNPSADGATSSALAARGRLPDAGDFGDLSDATNLARLRSALIAAAGSDAAASTSGTRQDGRDLTTELATRTCLGSLPAGTITALATGTLDGRPAIVVLTTTPDGDRSIDAVLTDPCTVRPLS
jgi:hypothetical protein